MSGVPAAHVWSFNTAHVWALNTARVSRLNTTHVLCLNTTHVIRLETTLLATNRVPVARFGPMMCHNEAYGLQEAI